MKCLLSVFVLEGLLAIFHANAHAAPHSSNPQWSFILYAATDESDLAHHSDPLIEEMLKIKLPPSVEILIEQDTDLSGGTRRMILRSGERPRVRTSQHEEDSASRASVTSFLQWAKENARGKKKMLIPFTHSWGWKGIIQDYTIPNRPDSDTIMLLSVFTELVKASGLRPDIFFPDSCVLGSVEALDYFTQLAPFVIVSQRETPYSGFPLEEIIETIEAGHGSPEMLAREIPKLYAAAYSRGGSKSHLEGEYDLITIASIRSSEWSPFKSAFRNWVKRLGQTGLHQKLLEKPTWPLKFVDREDSYADLLVLMRELKEEGTQELHEAIGSRPEFSREQDEIILRDAQTLTITIQGDEILPLEVAQKSLRKRWSAANQGVRIPRTLRFNVLDDPREGRVVKISGKIGLNPFRFRPWIPGATWVRVNWKDRAGKNHREEYRRAVDYEYNDQFEAGKLLIAEAHSQGSPYLRSIAIHLKPRMDCDEIRASHPELSWKGPDFYRMLPWNQDTGWAHLILNAPKGACENLE